MFSAAKHWADISRDPKFSLQVAADNVESKKL